MVRELRFHMPHGQKKKHKQKKYCKKFDKDYKDFLKKKKKKKEVRIRTRSRYEGSSDRDTDLALKNREKEE